MMALILTLSYSAFSRYLTLQHFVFFSYFGSDDTGSDAGKFKLLPRVVRVLGCATLQNLLILVSISACAGTVVHHALGVVTKQIFHEAG